MNAKKHIAILVGGGPAPGINGVIAAAAIEATKRGHMVLGIQDGFSNLMKGDLTQVHRLAVGEVSRIHGDGGSILGTSRANPTKSDDLLRNVVNGLKELGVGYLVTIGGDDTASSAKAVASAAEGAIAVGHVPKTIDNDLPLPNRVATFGFESAREAGTEIVETLMTDSKTTSRWYLVIAMGRKAGHLALGVGLAAGATLTVIPEDFAAGKIPLRTLADIIVGSILKRLVEGRPYGVAVLAEGLAEVLEEDSIPELAGLERDPHGHVRLGEIDFGRIVKNAVRKRLEEFHVTDLVAIDKDVGYELRCRAPNAYDRDYTRQLGYGVIDFLLAGGTEALISRQQEQLVPIPFSEIIDERSGRSKVRMVDTQSHTYRVAHEYMIRLSEKDLAEEAFMEALAGRTKRTVVDLRRELGAVAREYGR